MLPDGDRCDCTTPRHLAMCDRCCTMKNIVIGKRVCDRCETQTNASTERDA